MGSRGLQCRAGMAPDSPSPLWQEAAKPASAVPVFFQLLCLSSPCAETPVPPGDKASRSPCAPKAAGGGVFLLRICQGRGGGWRGGAACRLTSVSA